MEIEQKNAATRHFSAIRLPLGGVAVAILVADYLGWGWEPLTDAAVVLVVVFQVLLCLTYLALLWTTSPRHLPSLYGWPLLRRYFYVLGFAFAYAITEHWWLATFQFCVLVTLTAFVVEHKKQVDPD